MYKEHRVLAVIPARGGSKGVSRKNVRLLAGKPLIVWTIEQAAQSRYIDTVLVSSEDEEICQVARQSGAEVSFVRPAGVGHRYGCRGRCIMSCRGERGWQTTTMSCCFNRPRHCVSQAISMQRLSVVSAGLRNLWSRWRKPPRAPIGCIR